MKLRPVSHRGSRRHVPAPRQSTQSNESSVQRLLRTLATFLRLAGVDASTIRKELGKALAATAGRRRIRKMRNISVDEIDACAEALYTWTHEPAYLQADGRPKELSASGKKGLRQLLRKSAKSGSVNKALALLQEFGTVRRTSSGTYKLARSFASYGTKGHFCYEPCVDLLVDALNATIKSLTTTDRKDRLFFYRVQNSAVPTRFRREFLAFARTRTLAFLNEIDDWLTQHSLGHVMSQRKGKTTKLSLAVFPASSL